MDRFGLRQGGGFAILAIALAACGGSEGSSSPTATSAPSTALSSTTTFPVSFDLHDGSPVDHLGSFTAHLRMSVELSEGIDVRFESEAVYVGAAFSCEVTTWYGSAGQTVSLVATSETTWIDDEDVGFVVVDPLDAQATLDLCPGWPGYWEELTTSFPMVSGGEPEVVNAIAVRRFDLSEEVDSVAGLGFPQDVALSEVVIWLADPAGWVAQMHMAMTIGSETWAEWVGAEPTEGLGVTISYMLWVADPDEATLMVEVPGVGPVFAEE